MLKRKVPTKLAIALISAAGFGTLTQMDAPLVLKPLVLLVPLQIAAIAYVIWYWRVRPASTDRTAKRTL